MRKFNVSVNGKSYEVEVEENLNGSAAPIIEAKAKPMEQAPVAAKAVEGGTILKSPMPGLILNMAVANGAVVKKGQKLIILEAMKMENDINSPVDGIVTFLVKKGDTVETGTELASIK